MYEIVMIVYRT